MSWLGLFLLVWLGLMLVPVSVEGKHRAFATGEIAAFLTLACWLLAQGRW